MDRLNQAIIGLSSLEDVEPNKVNIKGKWYATVPTRTDMFRRHYGSDANIATEVVFSDLERVVVKATITIYQDGEWRTVANGFAEEFRNRGMINKTSALENCETSAIGRALANLGLGGGEFASSFEVENAIHNKEKAPDLNKRYVLLSEKGAKISSFSEISQYVDELRKVMGKPEEQKCRDFYQKNKANIKKVYGELKDDDEFKSVFNDMIVAYETLKQ